MKIAKSLLGLLLASTAVYAPAEPAYVVVDWAALKPYWAVAGKPAHPVFPRSVFKKGIEACVAVGFAIDADGRTTNISVLRTVTNKPDEKDAMAELEAAARQTVAQWHFDAGTENAAHKAVYTYATISESLSLNSATKSVGDKHAHAVEDACLIPDFAAAVARGDFVQKGNPSP